MPSKSELFNSDLQKFNDQLEQLEAVVTLPDGAMVIDPTKAPTWLLDAYGRLLQYGYANGLVHG